LNQLSFVHPLTLNRVTPQTSWEIPKLQPPMAAGVDPGITTATIRPSNPYDPSKAFIVQMGHIRLANETLSDLVTIAYGVHPKQLAGAPAWADQDKFDISATYNGEGQPSPSQMQSMIRKLLAGHFKISLHHAKTELPVYVLSKAGSESKLARSSDDPSQPADLSLQELGKLKVKNGSMQDFVDVMQSSVLDRPVLDRTGLTGKYDFTLDWTPDDSQFHAIGAAIPHSSGSIHQPPPLTTALQQQMGLKLDSAIASIEAIVIDHVEKPAVEN